MKTLSLCIPLLVSLASCEASSLPKSVSFRVKTLKIPRGGSLVSSAKSARHKQQRRQISWPWQQQQKTSSTKLQSSVSLSPPLETNGSSRTAASSLKPQLDAKSVSLTLFSALALFLLYSNRQVILPFLDKDRIQQETLNLLRNLQPQDAAAANALVSPQLLLYAAGLAVWEIVGLSTIPVESAAGMVFGWKAVIYNALGKITGAMIAFSLGRYCLAEQVAHKLHSNELFQLVNAKPQQGKHDGKTPHTPLATAFLMKFSCFPEIVKNFGSSLLPVIKPWMFVLATLVHGGGFSLLWTWLGVDTARSLQGSTAAAAAVSSSSSSLQGALIVAGIVGVIITPLLMAWWIRDLKQLAAATRADAQRR